MEPTHKIRASQSFLTDLVGEQGVLAPILFLVFMIRIPILQYVEAFPIHTWTHSDTPFWNTQQKSPKASCPNSHSGSVPPFCSLNPSVILS